MRSARVRLALLQRWNANASGTHNTDERGNRMVRDIVTDQMAIDLGTASTIIAVKDRGVVLDEPSLIAINELTEEIVARALSPAARYHCRCS